MKILKRFSTLVVGLLVAGSASALTLADVDVDGDEGEPKFVYMSTWGTSAWNAGFDLLTAGYDPATMEIIGATVSFAFADDQRKENGKKEKHDWKDDKSSRFENVDITVGGFLLWDDLEVDGSHSSGYAWYSQELSSNILSSFQSGAIDYSVDAVYGDFYLKEAKVVAEVGRINVPDTGATLGMLGLGVASLVILRRQMLKGKDA